MVLKSVIDRIGGGLDGVGRAACPTDPGQQSDREDQSGSMVAHRKSLSRDEIHFRCYTPCRDTFARCAEKSGRENQPIDLSFGRCAVPCRAVYFFSPNKKVV
jgi:hypothetical protein